MADIFLFSRPFIMKHHNPSTIPSIRARFQLQFGNVLSRLGRKVLPRDPDELMERAMRRTGLSDFGLPVFMEGYRALHHSLCHEAQLHSLGEQLAKDMLLNNLRNRLLIEGTKKACPEIAGEEINRPIIILGLPRTGSTFLHRLVSADPEFQFIQFKEAIHPAPPPALSPELEGLRYANAELYCRRSSRFVPRLGHMHRITPDSPEECYFLMRNNFMHGSFRLMGPITKYINWFRQQDLTECYKQYVYQMKILQFKRRKKRWILKAPSHWQYLTILLKTFPDAHIVQTHRHPKDIIPSWMKLVDASFSLHTTRLIDRKEHVRGSVASFLDHLDTLAAFREEHPEVPYCDVLYKDLTKDPIGQIRDIYRATGQPLSDESLHALNQQLERDRQTRSRHAKQPREMPDFNEQEIDQYFASYLARYGGL